MDLLYCPRASSGAEVCHIAAIELHDELQETRIERHYVWAGPLPWFSVSAVWEYVATHEPSYRKTPSKTRQVAASISQYMLPSAASLCVTNQEG